MKKLPFAVPGLVLVLPLLLSLSGCIEDDGYRYGGGYIYPTCQKFKSCDPCTRAYGCGWCMSGSEGLCVSDPDQCAGAISFSFTWEVSGCPGGASADGGVDYGPPVEPSSTDGGVADGSGVDLNPDLNAGTGADGSGQ